MSDSPVNVTVTGAAGQIGYAILFRIASGQMLGAADDQLLLFGRKPVKSFEFRAHLLLLLWREFFEDAVAFLRLGAIQTRQGIGGIRDGWAGFW